MTTTTTIVDFLNRVTAALGITATVDVEETADGPRFNLTGEDAELLVRHRGEPLKALQHVVDMSYGRSLEGEKRVFVDALEYRKGKDIEMRNMAKFLAGKVKESGMDQQMGPLNPYERRIVHMAVAEVPGVTTESVGDAFSKTVLISLTEVGALAAPMSFSTHDTIVAIATPPGRGGIGVVRLSGPGALPDCAAVDRARRSSSRHGMRRSRGSGSSRPTRSITPWRPTFLRPPPIPATTWWS